MFNYFKAAKKNIGTQKRKITHGRLYNRRVNKNFRTGKEKLYQAVFGKVPQLFGLLKAFVGRKSVETENAHRETKTKTPVLGMSSYSCFGYGIKMAVGRLLFFFNFFIG